MTNVVTFVVPVPEVFKNNRFYLKEKLGTFVAVVIWRRFLNADTKSLFISTLLPLTAAGTNQCNLDDNKSLHQMLTCKILNVQ